MKFPILNLISVVVLGVASSVSAEMYRNKMGSSSHSSDLTRSVPSNHPRGQPYLGNFDIEDSCQYKLCGASYLHEFSGGSGADRVPVLGSCSGECNDLAHRLVDSKFKKESLWKQCTDMCVEKYPFTEYRTYNERFTCMEECFQAFEVIAPHRHVAQACIHSACSGSRKSQMGQTSMECFEECTHHVASKLPREDWAEWSKLISIADCDPKTSLGKVLNTLECADQNLWEKLTKATSVSPDIHILCLNAMCNMDVKCGKQCLTHVTKNVAPEDLSKWHTCTFSSGCADINGYVSKQQCADNCLEMHKEELRRKAQMIEEERRKKEAEALLQSSNSPRMAYSSLLFSLCSILISTLML